MKKRSLRSKLIFQYMAFVVVCMLVIPTGIARLLDWQFRTFASERLQEDQQDIVEHFSKIYSEYGSWSEAPSYMKKNDLLRWPMVRVQLFDNAGCELRQYSRVMKFDGKKRRRDVPAPFAGPYMETTKKILVDGHEVGFVRFSCLPFSESREGTFLTRFNRIMYYAVAAMLALSALIALFMANRISRPVLNAASRAQQISRGKYRMEEKMESDITELQTLIDSVDRLGESLEAQEELRKRLLSDMAHELRNPVTIIKSHLEAIEDGVWEPTPERIRLTVSEVDRLSQLIREAEKLTSIEGAGHSISLESANVSSIVERAAMVFDPLYKNKGVELKREIGQGLEYVIDAGKIRQVIENLLSNALRYTDGGGCVTVLLAREDRGFRLEVADTGIGIAQADLPFIFERFYRTDVSRARTSGGLGIGLAIVKAIVEAHDGTIMAKSEPGKGSRFTVFIPDKGIK